MLHASMSEEVAEKVYNLYKAATVHDIVDCCKATEDKKSVSCNFTGSPVTYWT